MCLITPTRYNTDLQTKRGTLYGGYQEECGELSPGPTSADDAKQPCESYFNFASYEKETNSSIHVREMSSDLTFHGKLLERSPNPNRRGRRLSEDRL